MAYIFAKWKIFLHISSPELKVRPQSFGTLRNYLCLPPVFAASASGVLLPAPSPSDSMRRRNRCFRDGGDVTELNFKGKEFVYNHHLAVPFRPLEPHAKKGIGAVALDGNLIIHGDNLHALKALLPLYAGKVDCVFIDPPYNTGNEGWSYNDNVNSPMMAGMDSITPRIALARWAPLSFAAVRRSSSLSLPPSASSARPQYL
jgi:hypothetical protein